MSTPTSENLPSGNMMSDNNTNSASNTIDKHPFISGIVVGVCGNAAWASVMLIGGPIAGFWKDVLPPGWLLFILFVASVIFSVVLHQFFANIPNYHSYAHFIRYGIIILTVTLGLVLFITGCQALISVQNGENIEYHIKFVVVLSIIVSVLILETIYVNHMYRNIRRNKQQLDIRNLNETAVEKYSSDNINVFTNESQKILDAVNMRSRDFEKALLRSDMDTAITATIIPFRRENGFFITYLMDNKASYKTYSWMFSGGHVKSSENETPDAIAISRAKTEMGLTVKLVNQPVLQDATVENMMVLLKPNYVYRFHNPNAKCCREHGHEYHLDLVYLGEIDGISDYGLLGKCIEVKIPDGNKHDKNYIENKCNEAKNNYYRKEKIKEKYRKNVPDYVINMLHSAYCDYYDIAKGGKP